VGKSENQRVGEKNNKETYGTKMVEKEGLGERSKFHGIHNAKEQIWLRKMY